MKRIIILYRKKISSSYLFPLSLAALLFSVFSTTSLEGGETPSYICDLIRRVEYSRLEQMVKSLSGADSVYIDGSYRRIRTRHALVDTADLARKFLAARVGEMGYSPAVQEFTVSRSYQDITSVTVCSDGGYSWIADLEGSVYRGDFRGDRIELARAGRIEGEIYDLAVDGEGRLWSCCGLPNGGLGGLYMSEDQGESWIEIKAGPRIYQLQSITLEHSLFGIAAGTFGTLLRTADGGVSWSLVSSSQLEYRNLMGSAASDSLHFWVVSNNGYLFESVNSGVTWTGSYLGGYQIYDIDFTGEYGVIAGNGVVFYSRDGGESWNEVSVDADLRCVAMMDASSVLAVGGGGEVWMSRDGGKVWVELELECLSSKNLLGVGWEGGNVFWAGGDEKVSRVDIGEVSSPVCWDYSVVDTMMGENIIFRREGMSNPDEVVVLCAHYDAMAEYPYDLTPGADDNASGVAGVLECARVLRYASLDRSVQFILFDSEELHLVGSSYLVNHLDSSRVYRGVINLDMIGYHHHQERVTDIFSRDSSCDSIPSGAIRQVVDDCGIQIDPNITNSPSPSSDHMPFRDLEGVGSVLMIEHDYRSNPNYHSVSDVWSYLDYYYLEQNVRAALGAAALLAGYGGMEQGLPVLRQNYPNPFSTNTIISFSLPRRVRVVLKFYDVLGRRVDFIDLGERGPSSSVVYRWDGRNHGGRELSPGVYFVKLEAGGYTDTRKIVLVK